MLASSPTLVPVHEICVGGHFVLAPCRLAKNVKVSAGKSVFVSIFYKKRAWPGVGGGRRKEGKRPSMFCISIRLKHT